IDESLQIAAVDRPRTITRSFKQPMRPLGNRVYEFHLANISTLIQRADESSRRSRDTRSQRIEDDLRPALQPSVICHLMAAHRVDEDTLDRIELPPRADVVRKLKRLQVKFLDNFMEEDADPAPAFQIRSFNRAFDVVFEFHGVNIAPVFALPSALERSVRTCLHRPRAHAKSFEELRRFPDF